MLFCLCVTVPMEAQDWLDDLTAAENLAAQSDKKILLVFSGSDWCGPCKKLEQEVWQTEAFQKYASKNLVLVKADFPRKKANRLSEYRQTKNNELAGKYNPQGYFPLVVVMDAEGKLLGKTGYKSFGPDEYIQHLESFKL